MKNNYSSLFSRFVFALIAMVYCGGFVNAQTVTPMYANITTPVSNTGNSAPWGYASTGARAQLLFAPGIFGSVPSGMSINRIYFFTGTQGVPPSPYTVPLTVAMGQLPVGSSLPGTSWITGLTTVLNNSSYVIKPVSSSWFAIEFTTPFSYDPTLPLLVDLTISSPSSWLSTWSTSNFDGATTPTPPSGCYRQYAIAGPTASTPDQGVSAHCFQFGFDLTTSIANLPLPPIANFLFTIGKDTLWKASPSIIVNNSTRATNSYWDITGFNPTDSTGPWTAFPATRYPTSQGSFIDTIGNFSYIFPDRGYYRVKLVCVNKYGTSYIEKPVWVDNPTRKPKAMFFGTKSVVGVHDLAMFNDVSSYGPTSWSWKLNPLCHTCGLQYNNFTPADTPNPYLVAVDPGVYDVCVKATNSVGTDSFCRKDAIKVLQGYFICNGVDVEGKEAEGYLFSNRDGSLPPTSYIASACGNGGFKIVPCADSITVYLERLRLRNQDSLYIKSGAYIGGTILRRFGGNNFAGLKDEQKILQFAGKELYVQFVPGGSSGQVVADSGFALRWSSVSATYPVPHAEFYVPDTVYSAQKVIFQNKSTGVNLIYEWDLDNDGFFGDSTNASPSMTYYTNNVAGDSMRVCLRTSNCRGSDDYCKSFRVMPTTQAPVADFAADRTTGFTTDTFYLMDKSKNGANQWKWRFSPNNVSYLMNTDSNSQNPIIFLNGIQPYDVTLVATNQFGTDQIMKTAYLSAKDYGSPNTIYPPSSVTTDIGITRVKLEGTVGAIDTITPLLTPVYNRMFNFQHTTVYRGGKYTVEVYRNTNSFPENLRAWIDFNRNADYTDTGETVIQKDSIFDTKVSMDFIVPSNATIGNTRMLVGAASYYSTITPYSSVVGLYEDYTVIIGMDYVKPVVTLNGSATMKAELNKPFVDPGATAYDNIQKESITDSIRIAGNVDITKVGYYDLKYYVLDFYGNVSDTVIRTVQVEVNITGPSVTLLGEDTVLVEVDSSFIEPGYYALDNVGDTITSAVTRSYDQFDTTRLGYYTLIYTVRDAFGFTDMAYRVVHVIDTLKPWVKALTGRDTVFHQIGTLYDDNQYVKVYDNYWTNITPTRKGVDNLNIDVKGDYTIIYTATDGSGNVSDDYRLTVRVTNLISPIITINGLTEVTVPVLKTYNDQGATAKDYKGNYLQVFTDLSRVNANTVTPTGDIGDSVVYTAMDSYGNVGKAVRYVKVADMEAPEITLLGNNPYSILKGTPYVDPGYKIIDNYNGDITVDFRPDYSKVDTGKVGTYPVYYNAKDAAGNAAQQKIRYVKVEPLTGLQQITRESDVMTIYPNPSRGIFNIDIKAEGVTTIRVYNIVGLLVREMKVANGQTSEKLDMTGEKDGIYLVRMEAGSKVYTAKITLAR